MGDSQVLSEGDVCLLTNQFKDMVADEARKVFVKLPVHTRVWVSLEDIIQDGMAKLITEIIPKYNGNRRSLTSFVYTSLSQHMDDCYTCKFSGREKNLPSGRRSYYRRDERRTIAIEDLAVSYDRRNGERRNCWDVLHSLAKNVVYSDSQMCWVVPMLVQIHESASDSLQIEMVHWFVTGERHRVDTEKFCVARAEFRGLAGHIGLDVEDCRHLFQSPECMDQLTKELHV